MKVVIDTNVFVSGVFWKGPPYHVLQLWAKGAFKLVVSSDILQEYRRVLQDLAIHRPGIKYEQTLELINLHSEIINPVSFTKPICTDPDDDIFLATALSANASFIISGDKALLKQDGFCGIQVLSPSKFLKKVE